MSNDIEILDEYNSDIIFNQTKLIMKNISEYPFIIIRTGWDQTIVDIDEPFVLRTSIRKNCNDRGTIIPDSAQHELGKLLHFNKLFEKSKVPFSKKKNDLCWRGAYSGFCDTRRKCNGFVGELWRKISE